MPKVTLTRDQHPNRKGDTVTVTDATAARLIARGAAKPTKPKPTPEPPADPDELG